jgi:predicted lipid-binding transport protein (Tim44 family)
MLAVRMLWPSFILAGGMLVGKLTGQSGWSIRELSLGFALSIIVGLLAARLSRRWRGESPQDVATDVNHPDQPSFVSIRRKRTRAPDE